MYHILRQLTSACTGVLRVMFGNTLLTSARTLNASGDGALRTTRTNGEEAMTPASDSMTSREGGLSVRVAKLNASPPPCAILLYGIPPRHERSHVP